MKNQNVVAKHNNLLMRSSNPNYSKYLVLYSRIKPKVNLSGNNQA